MPGTRRVRTVKPASLKKDEAIIGTNDYSIVSKRSVEKLYYSREPKFLKPCVSRFKRRAPLINRGYWLRMRAIDQAVQDFLREPSETPKIVVNLGCGYDPLPFQSLFRYPGHMVRYVDVDYPQCIEKKVEMMRGEELYTSVVGTVCTVEPPLRKSEAPNDPLGTQVNSSSTHPIRNGNIPSEQGKVIPLSSGTEKSRKATIKKLELPSCSTYFKSERYVAIGCDLRQLAALREALIREIDIFNCAVLFVAEVSITYMDVEAADAVIGWAAEFDNSRFCLLEQYLPDGPDHPFAKTMIEHFGKQTPIRPIHRYPLLADQKLRFQHRGWSTAAVQSLWDFWNDGLDTEERTSLDTVEPFDEWEEFAMFAGHYFVLRARNSPASDPVEGGTDTNVSSAKMAPIPCQLRTFVTSRNPQALGLRRFGAVMPGDAYITYHGGLNGQSRHSGRDVYTKSHVAPIDVPKEAPDELMCHTITQLHEKNEYLLVGGRTSPLKSSSSCWHYRDNTWCRVHDLEPGRYRHCAVCVPTGVLIFGGKTGSGTVVDEWMHWDPIAGWQAVEVPATRPAARFGASMAVADGDSNKGILLGGVAQSGIVLKDFWRWTLKHEASGVRLVFEDLTEKAQKSCLSGVYARFGASLILSRWGLLLIGGVSSGGVLRRKEEILALSPNGVIAGFEIVSPSKERPLLVGFGAVAVNGGDILVLGGGAVCFSFGAFWNNSCYLLHKSSGVSPELWHLVSDTVSTDEQTAERSKHAASLEPARPNGSTSSLNVSIEQAADQQNVQSIPRIHVTTAEDTNALIKAAQPAIIEGLNLGTCTTAWTLSYLAHQIGPSRPVIVHSSPTKHMDFQAKNFSYTTQPFGAFLDSALSGGGHLYLRALSSQQPSKDPANLRRDFPTIAADFCLPEPLSTVTDNEHSSVLRISGDVDMWLHYDVMANVYCQIRGHKRLVLFPPSDVRALRFPPGSTTSNVNVFAAEGDALLARTRPREALLEPGDVLFIPSCWPHAATPVGDAGSVAVNVFFRDLESGYAAGKDVYGNRDLEAYQNGRRDVERICKMVAAAPGEEAQAALERCAKALLGEGELGAQERGAKEVRRMVKSVEGLPGDVGRFYLDRLADELLEKAGLSQCSGVLRVAIMRCCVYD